MNDSLPLSGRRIVVTRAEEQSGFISNELEKLGASVLGIPTIRIEAAMLSPEDDAKVAAFGKYDVAIFTSTNAVTHVLSRVVLKKGKDGKPFVVAIGKRTAEMLNESGIAPDFIPDKFNSADLMKSIDGLDWKGKKVFVPKGSLTGSEVADSIKAHGGTVEEVVVYNTLPNDSIDGQLKGEVKSGKFDAIVFFSPSQIKNFLSVFGNSVLRGKEIAVIGPTTKKAAESSGLHVDVMPGNSTTESLIASMVEHEKAG